MNALPPKKPRRGRVGCAASLRFIAESSSIAALTIDGGRRVRQVNEAYRKMAGLAGPVTGVALTDLVFPETHEALERLLRQASPSERLRFKSGEGAGFRLTCRVYQEAAFQLLFGEAHILTGSDVLSTIGRLNNELAMARMEAERKNRELERALEEQRQIDALREADRHKGEFLATLAHELRNPLAPITNSLYILERGALGDELAKRALATLNRQVSHMTRLVNDLLDVTRISRGQIRLERQRTDLNLLLGRVAEDMQSVFASAGVLLLVSLPSEILVVSGDPARLAQAVANLLGNAAKFTPRGGRTMLTMERGGATAVIRVQDNGSGMTKETIAKLFSPLVRAENEYSRQHGGLGLGLALVKDLVALHGGEVSADSPGLGLGSEFVLRLPLEMGLPTDVPEVPAVTSGSRRVLLVEDNLDSAESLRMVLEMDGYRVDVAHDGNGAVAKARTLRPEVVLCDIGLPDMDGYQVARTLRSDPWLREVTLIALTGYAAPEDVARSKAAGFDHHLAKPPNIAKLEEVLMTPTRAVES